VLLKERADPAHEGASKVGHAPAIGMFDAAEETDRKRADNFVEKVLERSAVHYV
jgi:hypothetical protein